MSFYTLNEIEHLDNVVIIHSKRVSGNKVLNLLFNIHNSGIIQKYVDLPFKRVWDTVLFGKLLKTFVPDYIVFTTSWHSDHLVNYFRTHCRNSKLLYRFSDRVSNGIGDNVDSYVERIRTQFDGVLVYSQEDAEKYGFAYHSVGYSIVDRTLIKPCIQYDVVFIGAEKGRLDKIRRAFQIFKKAGLSCFFYVIMVKKEDRQDDGIIYGDDVMSFRDYLSYEISAKCLFEIVQEGSSGRTFRMMESIMYNKLLITNCREITHTDYYLPEYVQLYSDVSEIDPAFVVNYPDRIDYHYKGDFSPSKVLEFIEKSWQ